VEHRVAAIIFTKQKHKINPHKYKTFIWWGHSMCFSILTDWLTVQFKVKATLDIEENKIPAKHNFVWYKLNLWSYTVHVKCFGSNKVNSLFLAPACIILNMCEAIYCVFVTYKIWCPILPMLKVDVQYIKKIHVIQYEIVNR
jgi:hypothetical protein